MVKNLLLVIFSLLTTITYGQKIIFQKNINSRARTLEQNLNKNRDSLILKSSKKIISHVDIFNEDFAESIDVNSNSTKIDLSALPFGDFIVQAKLGRKNIIMYLRKTNNYELNTKQPKFKLKKVFKITSDYDIDISDEALSSSKRKYKNKKKNRKINVKYYWVVYESNSNFGSNKSMKLVYKDELPNLIEKNKLELQSKVGSDNVLLVYAIYHKNKFMRKQIRNSKYYKSVKKSKFFNVVPYYSSLNEQES
ncbi:hypothetical protein [Psychroserpens sp.]|uniref:hypothetical protein n=1 Tax=Psychroserpens sp. TaxID=2020870 RepID=UPI00385EAE5D